MTFFGAIGRTALRDSLAEGAKRGAMAQLARDIARVSVTSAGVEGITEGAACTTLLAKQYINNDKPLVMANSDQYVEWDSNEFMYSMVGDDVDGGILAFKSTLPKWSYAKLGDAGLDMTAIGNRINTENNFIEYFTKCCSE